MSKAQAGRVCSVKQQAPLAVSHFAPTLEQFFMIAILCIDLLYSCAHHAENAEETDAVFLEDIMFLITPLLLPYI